LAVAVGTMALALVAISVVDTVVVGLRWDVGGEGQPPLRGSYAGALAVLDSFAGSLGL